MAYTLDNGDYAYDYTDPDYTGVRCGKGKFKFLPEHYCPKELWSQYTTYLDRLHEIIKAETKRLHKIYAWPDLCNREDYSKLQMYSLHVSIRLNNSAMRDATAAGIDSLRDYYLQQED